MFLVQQRDMWQGRKKWEAILRLKHRIHWQLFWGSISFSLWPTRSHSLFTPPPSRLFKRGTASIKRALVSRKIWHLSNELTLVQKKGIEEKSQLKRTGPAKIIQKICLFFFIWFKRMHSIHVEECIVTQTKCCFKSSEIFVERTAKGLELVQGTNNWFKRS